MWDDFSLEEEEERLRDDYEYLGIYSFHEEEGRGSFTSNETFEDNESIQ